jgi:hypothetical protein
LYGKQKNLVRYILRKFAEHHESKFTGDFEVLTIEHFHPESKISNEWPGTVVGSLGNMFFSDESVNEKLGDKTPEEKRAILTKAGCSIPAAMAKSEPWTTDAVKKNAEEMAGLAFNQIWKI